MTEIPALHQGQAVLHNLAPLPESDHLPRSHAWREAILTAVQALPGQVQAPVQTQPERIFQHAVGLQPLKYAAGRIAWPHIEQQRLVSHSQGLLQRSMLLPGEQPERNCCQQGHRQQQDKKFTDHESLNRSATTVCSLRVSGPTGQTHSAKPVTGQIP